MPSMPSMIRTPNIFDSPGENNQRPSPSVFRARLLDLANDYEQLHSENTSLAGQLRRLRVSRSSLGTLGTFGTSSSHALSALKKHRSVEDMPIRTSKKVSYSGGAIEGSSLQVVIGAISEHTGHRSRISEQSPQAISAERSRPCSSSSGRSRESHDMSVAMERQENQTASRDSTQPSESLLGNGARGNVSVLESMVRMSSSGRSMDVSQVGDFELNAVARDVADVSSVRSNGQTPDRQAALMRTSSNIRKQSSFGPVSRISISDYTNSSVDEAFVAAFSWAGARSSFEAVYSYQSRDEAYKFAEADCGVFMPTSVIRLTWDFCIFVTLVFELWVTPFEVFFCSRNTMPAIFTTFSHIVIAFFCADIAINFNTGYFSKDQTIMKRFPIARRYLRFWFWADVISILPWEFFTNGGAAGGFLRWVRFGKVAKVVKIMRYLKFVRSIQDLPKSRNTQSCLRRISAHIDFGYITSSVKVLLFLMITSHVHGCIWAILHPNLIPVADFDQALAIYFDAFYWAYASLTVGNLHLKEDYTQMQPHGVRVLEVIVATERVSLLAVLIIWGVFEAHTRYTDDIRLTKLQADALDYLKRHQVSFATQVQVLYILHETGRARQRQRHFRDLMDNDLPVEVKRKICSELFLVRLRSLGLIDAVSKLHGHFLVELALLVREEVFASKATIFHWTDASIASYYVMDGSLVCMSDRNVPEFVTGHWIGEVALVNPLLQRGMTIVTKSITALMAVPAEGFQQLLTSLQLSTEFQNICQKLLWKGFCGRCGALGDHFADMCPIMVSPTREHTTKTKSSKTIFAEQAEGKQKLGEGALVKFGGKKSFRISRTSESLKSVGSRTWEGLHSLYAATTGSLRSRQSGQGNTDGGMQSNLHKFLQVQGLAKLIPSMSRIGINTLSDLETIHNDELSTLLANDGEELTTSELFNLSPSSIHDFARKMTRSVQRQLFDTTYRDCHFIFISHSKSEAGTEAVLLRKELEHLIANDLIVPAARNFDVPVFLDSEDLISLKDLKRTVNKSHNLIVLLTSQVLTRPWVLVEIVTAIRAGITIIPMQVSKPGAEFQYPGEDFYAKLFGGNFFEADGAPVLVEAGVSILEVEASLREMFRQIALSYSPHRHADIRHAEVKAALKRCHFRQGDATMGTSPTAGENTATSTFFSRPMRNLSESFSSSSNTAKS